MGFLYDDKIDEYYIEEPEDDLKRIANLKELSSLPEFMADLSQEDRLYAAQICNYLLKNHFKKEEKIEVDSADTFLVNTKI